MIKIKLMAFALVAIFLLSSCGDKSTNESGSNSSASESKESQTESNIDSSIPEDEESSKAPVSLPFIPFE